MLLAFFLVNLAFTGFLAVSHDKASSDALSYYALAQNLADGKGLSRDHKSDPAAVKTSPPFRVNGRFLYPWFVSLGFRVFGESIGIANLVAAIFKAVLVIPILLIAKYLFDDDLTGLAAGLIYTVSPAYTSLGTIAMPETTASAFYYVSVLLFLLYYVHSPGSRTMRRGLIAAAGLALSLAYLARPEALLLLLLGLVTIWLGSRRWTDVLFLLLFPALTFTVGSLLIYGRMGNVSPYQTPLTTLPDWADFYVLSGFSLATYLGRVGGLGGALAVRVYNCLLFLRHTFADGLWLTGVVGLLPFTFIPALAVAFFRPLSRSFAAIPPRPGPVQLPAARGDDRLPRLSEHERRLSPWADRRPIRHRSGRSRPRVPAEEGGVHCGSGPPGGSWARGSGLCWSSTMRSLR